MSTPLRITASMPVPRYLVPFHPKRIPHHFADVLVIGGGIAGLRAAMEIDPRLVAARDHQGRDGAVQQRVRPGRHRQRARSGRQLRQPRRRHAGGRGQSVRPRSGRDGRPRSARAHPAAHRLGHQVRHGKRRAAAGPRGRAQPSPHRPRAGRRHRPRSDAGDDPAWPARSTTRRSGRTRSRSTC